ncbi:BspA family leucine-rich repeat surface protein [Winogradskyella maritima]|uniref:BspA family leucine-rich repeat surface protein n=1 Tax=Winogradskyella maritima TaxID=1517766 RepID=A0ABV8AJ92_9FLAO|nr:BspA family leucine-rich repeat surface protein [Winogradskyella maritima]
MKKSVLRLFTLAMLSSFLFLACSNDDDASNNEPRPFVTQWRTDTNDQEITIRTNPNLTDYDYSIDWGDGTIENNLSNDAIHTYANAGTYIVEISGDFPAIFSQTGDFDNTLKLISIDSWGDIQWQSMQAAFRECRNLEYNATDVPDLSQVTDMSSMFQTFGSSIFNGDLDDWDVSNVTNMNNIFARATSFNSDLNNWDVRNVNDMDEMFANAENFNGDISDWNVGNVITMRSMFFSASAFNSNISGWNVSSVTNMDFMLNSATVFNQNLSGWATDNVVNCMQFGTNSALTDGNYPTAGNCF